MSTKYSTKYRDEINMADPTILLADTAHDLCTLVTSFNTRLYLIKKSPHQLPTHLIALEHLVNHMDALVHNLMLGTQPEFDEVVQSLNLNDIVMSIIKAYEPIAQRKGVTLAFEAEPDLLPIWADRLDMERVVVNLLCNALNYTPESGTITLTTSSRGTDSVFLAVRDTGIGISSHELPHIFKRFYRTEQAQSTAPGTGLGLAIVQGIVEKYNGQIDVESSIGLGSIFKVILPVLPPPES